MQRLVPTATDVELCTSFYTLVHSTPLPDKAWDTAQEARKRGNTRKPEELRLQRSWVLQTSYWAVMPGVVGLMA